MNNMSIYDDVPSRIKAIYNSSPKQEQYYLRKILEELADKGYSETYEKIWLSDYKEIPVDIDTFLDSNLYLGESTRQGSAIYPTWRRVMQEIFHAGNKYEEIILSGATRIGKSSTGVNIAAYMTYWLMCLRDPQKYFNKKDVSIFSILFFNVTKDLARGVAYREYNDTLKSSQWFNEHGTFSKSERNFYYIPEGGRVSIDYGSDASHGLGKQVFCVVGNTDVLTDCGSVAISDISGNICNLAQYDANNECIVYASSEVLLTKYVSDTIQIELEDGTIFEGTPDHQILCSGGYYKRLDELTEEDDIQTV